jgi:hypothetical protein
MGLRLRRAMHLARDWGARLRRQGAANRQLTCWLESDLALRQQQRYQTCVGCDENSKDCQGHDSSPPTHRPEHNCTTAIDSGLPARSTSLGKPLRVPGLKLALRSRPIPRDTSRGTCPSRHSEALSQVAPACAYRRCRCSAVWGWYRPRNGRMEQVDGVGAESQRKRRLTATLLPVSPSSTLAWRETPLTK